MPRKKTEYAILAKHANGFALLNLPEGAGVKEAEKFLKTERSEGEYWIVAIRRKIKLKSETRKIVKFEAVE